MTNVVREAARLERYYEQDKRAEVEKSHQLLSAVSKFFQKQFILAIYVTL